MSWSDPCSDCGSSRADCECDVVGMVIHNTSSNRLVLPLEMIWKPKEDITTYELALCLPYLFRSHGVMSFEIDRSLVHFRHFEIIDHNK